MILVTGATGHIGNVLVRELTARGLPVRALILPGEDCLPLAGLRLECCFASVLDLEGLRRACQGVDTVYHLAGMITIMPGADEKVRLVNVEGTRNVIQAAREAGVRRLVYTSSIHAITRVPHGVLIDETVPLDPESALSAYDRSKAQASQLVLEAARQGLDAVIVCPTGVIGPFDFRGSEMGHIIQMGMRGGLQVCVTGLYDFVDVRDVAQGMMLAADHGSRGERYLLSGEQIRLGDIMRLAKEFAGVRAWRLDFPAPLAHALSSLTPFYYRVTRTRPLFTPYAIATVQENSAVSSAKAQRELGYRPRPVAQSIADTVAWFLASKKPAFSRQASSRPSGL